MLTDILSNFNFIDVIMGLIIIRCSYVGATAGLVTEFFKLIGMLFVTFIAVHYFTAFAGFLNRMIFIPLDLTELISFVLLWITVVFLFKIIRDGWMLVIKTEAQESFNRWGGALTGIFRGLLVCGMSILMLFLFGNQYITKSINNSFSGFYLADFSPAIYNSIFDDFVGKLFSKEKKNMKAFTVRNTGQPKKKDK